MVDSKKTQVLILCTANSARSQMAEGLLRHLAGDQITVYSAGAKPSVVNPFAIQAMAERDIDISHHRSEHLQQYLDHQFDYVITVCDRAAETCPVFPGPAERLHHGFDDPADVEGSDADKLASFRRVRDEIEEFLKSWVATL